MTTVQNVLDYIQEEVAPTYMKEDWDRVGLLCGRHDRPVRKILVALDAFAVVCREAAEAEADLLVTHHPVLWKCEEVSDGTATGRNLLFLIEHGIAAINAHTNLDCAPGGVNDCLAAALGLQQVQVLNPLGTDGLDRPYGLLRQGCLPSQNLETFLSRVKEGLGCPHLRYSSAARPVESVAVGGGSCAGELEAVSAAGCDTFVTADVKYNRFADAQELGVNLVDAGHFWTENPVCASLARRLQVRFPDVRVKLSKNHTDCIKFF